MPLDPTPVPDELKGLRIAILVAGGIAAYKIVDLASALTQAGAEVRVAMTASATRFVGGASFQGVTGNPVLTSLWTARDREHHRPRRQRAVGRHRDRDAAGISRSRGRGSRDE